MIAGILSDTHISQINDRFKDIAERAFAQCEIIFHAGDITSSSVLEFFAPRLIHAVHGNMCNHHTKHHYPFSKEVIIDGFKIGICHGAGPQHNIEERMWSMFADADCIIYGHTHQPVCEKRGGVLFINPGSFQCTSTHGTPASYAILEITKNGLNAALHTITLSI